MVLMKSAFNEVITQFILKSHCLEKEHVANLGYVWNYNETLIFPPTGGRPSALHSSAQALVASTAEHEDHQDNCQLLQCGLQSGDRDLSNPQCVVFFFDYLFIIRWFSCCLTLGSLFLCHLTFNRKYLFGPFWCPLLRHQEVRGAVPAQASRWSLEEEKKKRKGTRTRRPLGHRFTEYGTRKCRYCAAFWVQF